MRSNMFVVDLDGCQDDGDLSLALKVLEDCVKGRCWTWSPGLIFFGAFFPLHPGLQAIFPCAGPCCSRLPVLVTKLLLKQTV